MYTYLVCHISADCPPGANVSAYNNILMPCLCIQSLAVELLVDRLTLLHSLRFIIQALRMGGGGERRQGMIASKAIYVDW